MLLASPAVRTLDNAVGTGGGGITFRKFQGGQPGSLFLPAEVVAFSRHLQVMAVDICMAVLLAVFVFGFVAKTSGFIRFFMLAFFQRECDLVNFVCALALRPYVGECRSRVYRNRTIW
jgi:hypothetical protein